MSFTIAHAAAALPFYKSRLCLPAIIVGCMVPDFEYFIYFDYIRRGAHSFYGLFYFCIPVGLLILFLYYNIWRYIIADICPDILRARLLAANTRPYNFFPAKRLFIIIISIILGALLHDAGDAVSHSYGGFTKIWPWLLHHVPMLPIQWWALFYGLGSILGMFLLMLALILWGMKTEPMTNCPPRILPSVSTMTILAVTGIIFSTFFMLNHHIHCSSPKYIAYFVMGAINYSIIIITLIGIWHRLKCSRNNSL